MELKLETSRKMVQSAMVTIAREGRATNIVVPEVKCIVYKELKKKKRKERKGI